MKNFRPLLACAALTLSTAFLPSAYAQSDAHHGHAAAPASKAATAELTEGEVRKVDKEGKKITFKHGPIKNLDMPPMTMAFIAADASLLDKVKVGDKVRFVATNPGGKLTVTEIRPAP
ncbi:MAG: copper-binding protein [Ramlibacter sp.]|nr:copper-binding protein [Ramlibacter sp.]